MAITVNFYTNKSDNRCLTKNLESIVGAQNVSCDVYQPCDRLDPILIIDRDRFDISTVNYCEILEFGRKYFITGVEGKAGNKVHMSCHVDVLGTYDKDLRNCPLIAARSTNNVNYYLHDDMRLFNTYAYNQYIEIGGIIGDPIELVINTLSYNQQT
jgi:hypothetical protein